MDEELIISPGQLVALPEGYTMQRIGPDVAEVLDRVRLLLNYIERVRRKGLSPGMFADERGAERILRQVIRDELKQEQHGCGYWRTLVAGSKFCPNCGGPLTAEEQERSTVPMLADLVPAFTESGNVVYVGKPVPADTTLASYVHWHAGGGTIHYPDGRQEPVRYGDKFTFEYANTQAVGVRVARDATMQAVVRSKAGIVSDVPAPDGGRVVTFVDGSKHHVAQDGRVYYEPAEPEADTPKIIEKE
jgi:hypothetical protein